ncbi:hypothetical protein LCI18_012843 [Fusarium solani-melongenae]|uniref:Uncharacterized protein n=1 Tax=Fusarium solani subsp. cucurbitae TaxID=2747967 RepID=A0ACD3ZLE7_FUSSC|nr:hypothetical protein LCI18_012843 [Fusarium solani-melongenae]
MASNEARLNEITRDEAKELTIWVSPNTLPIPVPDIVGPPLTRTCPLWKWLNTVSKSQACGIYPPIEDYDPWARPKTCAEQCQPCQLVKQSCDELGGSNRPSVTVGWRSIEETSFLRLKLESSLGLELSATLSAIGNTPNPWGLQGLIPSAESTWSPACVRLVHRWLDECVNNHPSCGSLHDPVLPTRVLDLGVDASARVSLWEPMGRRGRYACLSYCWGKSEFTVTTRGNLKDHLELGIELKDLPQTFQDAVEITRELKLRYLWIDALCIIQDDDDHEDWKRECGNMASIYRNSYLTIAAAWATSANAGCFTAPDPGVAIGPVVMRKLSHFPFTATPESSADFPILTRGWTFQERLLARRVIYFGRQEIVWQCIEMYTCECGAGNGSPPVATRFNSDNQITIEDSRAWRQLAMQYSPLQLTCPNDKLPALSGLAQAIRPRGQESYLAGLWKETLLDDMCWKVDSPKAKKPHQARWRAPSWSWASIDGPISYLTELIGHDFTAPWKKHGRVCEVKCTPAGPSLTGEVKDGSVALDGFLIPASVEATGIHANCSELESFRLEWFPDEVYEIEEMPVIYLVPILTREVYYYWYFYGLVVKRSGQGTEMTRVGLAALYEKGDFFTFFDCEKQIVKIV